MRQERTKRGMGMATKKGGRTGVCAEYMVTVVKVIGENTAFAMYNMVVEARKRVNVRKRFLTACRE